MSGDIVRFNTTNSVAVGSYNFTSRQLEGAGGGIWTQSKTTPNFENSPSLLFGKYQNQLIIAGHFEKLFVYFLSIIFLFFFNFFVFYLKNIIGHQM